jgi:hypothetical protein
VIVLAALAAWAIPAAAESDGRLTPDEIKQFGWDQEIVRPDGLQIHWLVRTPPVVDAGWKADRFPDHAACYKTPKEIAYLYAATLGNSKEQAVASYAKPTDGSLRIVGTGHSFMAPGYGTLPAIAKAAGFGQQQLLIHGGGGVTGSARYKWEEENGIFAFDGKPVPKLLASIANGQWDAMMWGPYFFDRPAYYTCWIDFCLKYNPQMKFYLVDTWPSIGGLSRLPASEDELTIEVITQMCSLPQTSFTKIVQALNEKYPGKVFLVPMCDAMLLAAKKYKDGKLPGIEGIHKLVGKKDRSLWVDQIGHLGPGFNVLEGYVFYATLYGRSPESITDRITRGDFPSPELEREFRSIAWQAVTHNPLSGVTDKQPAKAP